MNINRVLNINPYNQKTHTVCCAQNPIFCGKTPDKLIKKIFEQQDKKVKLTFEEAVKIYEYLGYDVVYKRGSHAIVPLNENCNLPLVIPHRDKYIAPMDVKRMKYVIKGEIDKAINIK